MKLILIWLGSTSLYAKMGVPFMRDNLLPREMKSCLGPFYICCFLSKLASRRFPLIEDKKSEYQKRYRESNCL